MPTFHNIACFFLTLFRPGGGHYGPHYHESVCRCRKVRATFTKLPDFVPFNVCQVQESQFWCLFFKKLKNIDVKNFWGSSSIRWKLEKIKKNIFFTNKPYFFKLNLNCTCSQLSFEVHCSIETQNFWNFEFFYYNINQIWRPLVAKLTNLKLSKMTFQAVFNAKNLTRSSFGLLVAPKPKTES